MICYILFVFFVLLYTTGRELATAYKPTDVFLINCGSTSDTIDTDGRTWTPELRKVFVSNLVNASFPSKASKEEPSVPKVPYMTARIFRSNFSYIFPVSPGLKFLRLYFYPTRYGFDLDAVNSFFSVTVNGFTIMRDFSADLTAKASESTYLIKEFIIPVAGRDKTLNLTLMPSPNSLAFLNGVEIVSMPDRLYTKGGFNDYIRDVGSTNDFEIDNITALETVYRLNVGGAMVNEVDDSGMFREWIPDSEFIPGLFKSWNSNNDQTSFFKRRPDPNVKINYTEKTPSYVAPEEVYRTFGSMGNTDQSELNLNFNMTWLFPVDAGFNYLVRLHFCETLPEVTQPGQRIFSIFIGNQIATLNTDVIYLSGGSRKPMYLDFNTFMASSAKQRGERPDLRLDLYPYKDDKPEFYDAILNGIEILKLNDTNGNLAGPNPNLKTLEGKLSVLMITLIALGSVTGLVTSIILLMLLMRQIKRKKNRKDNSIVMFKVLLRQYTYAELKKITKSFSHIVGKGGFGTVYGGNLCNGRRVAVKVLKDLKGNGEDFINEVTSMSQTSHVNIVSLLGFCHEGAKRAIVYEFLENGSLDQFISKDKSLTHDVTTLYGIALGIARGLEYLHYGCKTRIVHFDIKPQNILLDDNLCPKVSDFGLAKLCEKRESIMSLIDTRGTIGYIAPELVSRMYGGIPHKSDVYSYGMLVLDMIGARNKVETTTSNGSSAYFPDWIYKDLEHGGQTWIIGTNEEEKKILKN